MDIPHHLTSGAAYAHAERAQHRLGLRELGAKSAKKKPTDRPGTIRLEDGTLAVDANECQQRWFRHHITRTGGEAADMQEMDEVVRKLMRTWPASSMASPLTSGQWKRPKAGWIG